MVDGSVTPPIETLKPLISVPKGDVTFPVSTLALATNLINPIILSSRARGSVRPFLDSNVPWRSRDRTVDLA